MADPIYLVQGDTGPDVKVTFTRQDTGEVESILGATVKMHFRRKNRDVVLFSIEGDSTDEEKQSGVSIFSFNGSQLDIEPGEYEGEVEVLFSSGARETVYTTIDFILRQDFV